MAASGAGPAIDATTPATAPESIKLETIRIHTLCAAQSFAHHEDRRVEAWVGKGEEGLANLTAADLPGNCRTAISLRGVGINALRAGLLEPNMMACCN